VLRQIKGDPEVKKTIDGVKIITRRTRPVQELRTEPNTCIVNPVGSHQFIENKSRSACSAP
jgi:hypothetical protein